MEGSFVSASIQPPAADGSNPSSYPSWILLDYRARFADLDNATTVKAKASTGHEVKVTFCLAEPPAVSYFCVHCPETTEARVVSSANELVLLCVAFRTVPRSTEKDSLFLEYFVYKAASGGSQSIRAVPCSSPTYRPSWHAAILPCEDDHFLVADLVRNEDLVHYDLHIFSSETNEWSTTRLKLQTPTKPWDLPCQIDKVISLGGSIVGWVDLWRGIVICDVLEKDPVLRFLPLPRADFDLLRKGQARPVRDVTGCHNGFINFVEIKHCRKFLNVISRSRSNTPKIFETEDALYDTDLLSHDDDMAVTDDTPLSVSAGWKMRTMFRSISWDYWRKGTTIHVDDVSVCPTEPSMQLSQLWSGRDRKWTLRNLKSTSFPTFSICAGDVVYLVCKAEDHDKDAFIVGVDIGNKKLEVIKPYCGERATSSDQTFISCAFSEFLNATPSPSPCDEEVAAESAQNGVSNDHLSSIDTVPNNVHPQNWNVHFGSWNEDGYGVHQECYDNYQQPTLFQPRFILAPSLTQIEQPMSSTTSTQSEGYIYARWTELDDCGRMYLSVPLNEMYKPMMMAQPLATHSLHH